ncbi:TPA: DUF4165 domain-containing protein [Vibrio parahaemolyticus]|nr:DUF4165 domain-containing protein [Vibrio parahaemolyticus]HBC3916106.1 DUF4165 domain-containing protein [Vibrio parahaemolyticus]
MKKITYIWPLIPLTLFSAIVNAEVLSLSFIDTNNSLVELDSANEFFNPTTDITFSVSGGLDRKLSLRIEDSSGNAISSTESNVIGVNDRITALGRDYYGKTLTLSAPNDGAYSVVADIKDLSGEIIQTNTYPIVIDTTAPTLGSPQATSYGGLDGINMPADTWYTGYYSTNKYYVSDIADENSGVSVVNAITRIGEKVYKKAAASFDPQAMQAYIGNGSSWFPSGDNAETVYSLQFEVVDNAGNIAYSKEQDLYFDTVGGNAQLFAIHDPDSTNVMGGQAGYEPYVAAMTVKENPISFMYRIPRSNYANLVRGGITPVGHSAIYDDVDDQYVYVVFTRPYGFTNGNYVRFHDRRSWSIQGVSYNLKLDDSAPKEPVRKGNQYQYSDIGWSSWGREVYTEELPVSVTAAKIIVEPRDYDQVFEHMGKCTVPAGDTECVITYDPPKLLDTGTYGNLHSGSSIKNLDGSLYGQPGWASVHWNDTHHPEITSTEWDKNTKIVTVYAYQPNRGYYFDNTRITQAYLESNGQKLSVKRILSEENGTNYKYQFDLSTLPEGSYNVEAVVMEKHHNYARKDVVSFTNDTTPPAVTLLYNGAIIGDMIQGINGITVSAIDNTAMTILDASLSGGPSEDLVYLAITDLGQDTWKLEQPRIFPALQEQQSYTLTVRVKDEYNNIGTGTARFQYTPENWIKLENLKTLAISKNLLNRQGEPLARVTSSELRTDSGNLATGLQDALVTLRSDAPFGLMVEGVEVSPGQTKSIPLDLGDLGGKLDVPIYPSSNSEGIASFLLEVPELTSKYD